MRVTSSGTYSETKLQNIFWVVLRLTLVSCHFRFDKKCQAEAAITGMNGVVPEGGTEPLVVKVAEEHGKMKAAYYAGYHAGMNSSRGGAAGQGPLVSCITTHTP